MWEIKWVLLMRQYATSFSEEDIKKNLKKSTKDENWTTVSFNNHDVTFFFPGYGKKQIKSRISKEAFERLFITHLEIVSDIVPEKENIFLSIWGILKAVKYVIIDNQKNVWVFKTQFLKEFLK